MIQPEPDALPELLQDLHRRGEHWLPAGLGSRLDWGPAVREPCQVVSCARLDRILEHSPGDFTISVEAGMPLAKLQKVLGEHRQWISLDFPWGSEHLGSGSVGGLVARGLAGGYRQRYLGVRDQLIGIGLMRVDGVSARAGGQVVKNVAGYDLMRLFTGSWGSLGLITDVTLRTRPMLPWRRGLVVQGDANPLRELGTRLVGSNLNPERLDWWSPALAAAAGRQAEPMLLIALASVDRPCLDDLITEIRTISPLPVETVEDDGLEQLLGVARGSTLSHDQVENPHWLLRLGVPPSKAPDLLTAPELEGLAVEMAAESGLGLAWCSGPKSMPAERVEGLRRRCRREGGYVTVLHQPLGVDLLAWSDAPSRNLILALKKRFDPADQLAPGRLPGVAAPLQEARGSESIQRVR